MKVFLSWSGDRSKAAAEKLGEWLAQVIQAVEPWVSPGIEKGARWQSEIADRLGEAKVGIVCLTSSNLTAPWILFEAGALSKTKESYVCTFLLDVTPADVEPPLGQFQHTVFTRDDVLKLVQTINKAVNACAERFLNDQNLVAVFDTFWPQLETRLNKIKNQAEARTAPRPDRELLKEALEILRSQEQRAQKERQDKEVARFSRLFWDQVFPKIVSEHQSISASKADMYLDVLRNSEEDSATNAPAKPFEKKEPSNVEGS